MKPNPRSAYHQLFPVGGQTLPPYDPAEDGDHYRPTPHFFEWWYFDATFGDGSVLTVIFHSSLYNAVDHRPTLDVRYYRPTASPVVAVERFGRDAYRAAPYRCDVEIGDSRVVDEGGCYRLRWRHPFLEGELLFWPRLPGCRVGTGRLFFDPRSGRNFQWIVPVPRAEVEGVLSFAGRKRSVAGSGYHDHNWGNFYLPSAFRCWTWGRLFTTNRTLIFGHLTGRGNRGETSVPSVSPFILGPGRTSAQEAGTLQVGEGIRMSVDAVGTSSGVGLPFFRRMTVTLGNGETTATLVTRQVMDALRFAAPHPTLSRWPLGRGGAEAAYYVSQRYPGVGRLAACLLGEGTYLRGVANGCLKPRSSEAGEGIEMGVAFYEVMSLSRRGRCDYGSYG